MAERGALTRVIERPIESSTSNRNSADGDRQALLGQIAHQINESHSHFTKHVVSGDLDIVEEQLCGVLGVHPEFVQIAPSLETFHSTFQHQQRKATVTRIGVGAHGGDHHVAVDAVGDERLGAIDHPCVSPFHRGGLDSGNIASCVRLGDR